MHRSTDWATSGTITRPPGLADNQPWEMSFNGINGTTGTPLFTETPEQVFQRVLATAWPASRLAELRRLHEIATTDHLDTRFGVDQRRLDQAGWAVVFPHGIDPAFREALAPLLDRRRAQASAQDERLYRELTFRPNDTKATFLARHGASTTPVEPTTLPYYLLLVGSPQAIPFHVQYQLDVAYAVGRIDFERPEEAATYAASVIAAEDDHRPKTEDDHAAASARRAVFFAANNPNDSATRRSRDQLVAPLCRGLDHDAVAGWDIEAIVGPEATKKALTDVLGGTATPDLLFTASHGMGFEPDDPRQRGHQGALVCADWPGPGHNPTERHYFAADDIADDAAVAGLIAFHFACFGAGTPHQDGFSHHRGGPYRRCAPHSFVSSLPQRLLGHPKGGALAVIGHVDRAWTYSFDWPQAGSQTQVFESTLRRLLAGYPVGAAMEYFGQRHAELSADLSFALEDVEFGAEPDLLSLAGAWTANNDARSYVVLGDPAVRIPGTGHGL